MNREAERRLLCFKDTSGLVWGKRRQLVAYALCRCCLIYPPPTLLLWNDRRGEVEGGKPQRDGNSAVCTREGPASGVYRDQG